VTRAKKEPDFDYELGNGYYDTSKKKKKGAQTWHYEYDNTGKITKIIVTQIDYKKDGKIGKIVAMEHDWKTGKDTIKTLYGHFYNEAKGKKKSP